MTYKDTVEYLYNLTKHGIKLGLKNTRELLALIGNPEKTFRAVHIAGTNGKGSTARMLAELLTASGYRTGLFTSPHLVSFTERITINGIEITEDDVVRITEKIRRALKNNPTLKPTFFEFITALCFYYFAENSVQWAVVETGMGGRFDATNVLMPEASVITDIGMDHSEFLGHSLEKIACEKAGIIKESTPVITTSQSSEVMEVILKRAGETNSEVYLYERDFYTENVLEHRGVGFDFYSNRPSVFSIKGIRLPVYGKHQIRNAALSIETLLLLLKQKTPSEDTIVHALSSVEFPGRSDIRRINNRDIMFDGAHNPAAAEALGDTLRGLINSGTYSSIIVVLGIMSDKDIGGVMEPLINVADKLVLTRAAYGRSATTETLKAMAEKITKANGSPCGEIITANTVREALHRAQSLSSPDDLIVVTGSFYTAGEALELYGYRAVLTDLRERR